VLTAKVADVALASTVTEAGTVRAGEALLASATRVSADGGLESVTVQVAFALDARLAAAHWSEEMTSGATREMEADLEEPLRDAVMVAV
jgi:hypothetical protein